MPGLGAHLAASKFYVSIGSPMVFVEAECAKSDFGRETNQPELIYICLQTLRVGAGLGLGGKLDQHQFKCNGHILS